jgi:prepilin-type N-terminal cleavage/methylation domain-containing protein
MAFDPMKPRKQQGFSLLEMMAVIAIIFIVTSFSVMAWQPMSKQQHVNDAYNSTLSTLRWARDQAAADMRIYVVSFATPGTITVTQNTLGGPLLVTTVLPSDITFHVEPGVPTSPTVAPTTPDGFGTAANTFDLDQVTGGGGSVIYFYPDGTAQDAPGNGGNINNGVIYFGRVGELTSSRAITVWGSTSRLRGWRLYQNGGGVLWRQQ